jgi:hypothetical protein
VLATEVTELLRDASAVLDGTLGGGGHSKALLDAGVQRVIGVDRDPEALAEANARLAEFAKAGRFRSFESNYGAVGEIRDLAPASTEYCSTSGYRRTKSTPRSAASRFAMARRSTCGWVATWGPMQRAFSILKTS